MLAEEGRTADPAAVAAIARMADGGYRDALTLLEQAMLVSDDKITLEVVYDQLGLVTEAAVDELLLAIQSGRIPDLLNQLEEISRSGRDPRAILESMLHRLADLTRISYQVPVAGLDATREAAMHELSTRLTRDFLISIRSSLAEAHKVIRDISLPRLWLESELVRLATQKPQPTHKAAHAQPAQAQPVRKPAVQTPSRTEPASEPQSPVQHEQPAPVDAPKPVERDDDQPLTEQAGTSRPASAGGDIWQQLYNEIPDFNEKTGGVPPIKLKMRDAWLVEDHGNRIVIGLANQIFRDWVADDPKRVGYLQTLLKKLGRDETQLEFVVEKKNGLMVTESEAVELPLEGSRLEKAVKEIFGLNLEMNDADTDIAEREG